MSNPPPSFLESTRNKIKQQGWKRLLLAVSGGLDSICLAHFFAKHKADFGIEWLGIAHVHHGLREGTADRDAEFVERFADKLNISFFIRHLDGAALKSAGGSLEENARNARYEALREFAAENYADAILTAHHAGDQAETVYLRLRRGVSLAGLRGIQAINGDIFRPFLNVPREQLAAYARENNLQWCEDESNADVKFARNQIRHSSLPHLENLNPGTALQLCRVASLAVNVYSQVLAKCSELFESAIISLEQWPFDPKYTCYEKVLALDLKSVESCFNESAAQPGQFAELFRIWLGSKGFFLPLKEKGTSIPYPFLQRLQCKTIIMEKCRHILWICDTSSTVLKKSLPDNLYFGIDKFSGLAGQWRYRIKGDTLWPVDEKIKARKLEQWLREQGIPQWMHDSLPLYACGSRVLFVEGVRRPKK